MEQNTSEWLQWRKKGIGASDTPIILGVSRFKTPFILWNEKLGLIKEQGDSFITDLGHRFEPIARSEFALKEGIDLEPLAVQHADIEWLRASLDGLNAEEKVFAEIKYIGQEKFDQVKETGQPLEEHFPQLQHQFAVVGKDHRCVYIVYTLNEKKNELKDIHWIWPEIDEEYIQKTMFPAVEKFWKNLQTQTPPKLIDKDVVQVRGKKRLANKYVSIKKKISELEGQLEEVKEEILTCSKHPNFAIGDVKVTKSVSKGRVKYSAIKELEGVDLDQYRGAPSTSFRISVVKKKDDQ